MLTLNKSITRLASTAGLTATLGVAGYSNSPKPSQRQLLQIHIRKQRSRKKGSKADVNAPVIQSTPLLGFGRTRKELKGLKVDPIQPQDFKPAQDLPNEEILDNINTSLQKTKKKKFFYSPSFEKLGIRVNLDELPENWDNFDYKPSKKEAKNFKSAFKYDIPESSKISMCKNEELSTPFPRLSGNSPSFVAIPPPVDAGYMRGMFNNKKDLNTLDLTTIELIDKFLKINIANTEITSISTHTTMPSILYCSGIDLVELFNKKDSEYPVEYFKKFTKLFYLLSCLPKPHIALADGLVTGAGCGLLTNSGLRAVNQNTIFSVPDCAVGFFPNAGNARFLATLQDGIGTYLALTGRRLRGWEIMEAGIGNLWIPTENIPDMDSEMALVPKNKPERFIEKLFDQTDYRDVLDAEETHISKYRPAIKRCFEGKTTIEQILIALDKEKGDYKEWAQRCIKNLLKSSPVSLKVTMKLLNLPNMRSRDYFEMEYNLTMAFLESETSDLWEGIYSTMIAQCEPSWKTPITKLKDSEIDKLFAYKPAQQDKQLELRYLQTTFTKFENMLTTYYNDHNDNLTYEDERALSSSEEILFNQDHYDLVDRYIDAEDDVLRQDISTLLLKQITPKDSAY
eukprot:gene4911-6122_t